MSQVTEKEYGAQRTGALTALKCQEASWENPSSRKERWDVPRPRRSRSLYFLSMLLIKSKTPLDTKFMGNPHTHTPTNSLLAGDSSKMRVYRWNGMMSVICFQIPQEAKMYSDASGKEPACQCRRHKSRGFNPWVGKLPWKTGDPLQYSCLGNPTARGTWWATVHRVAKSQTQLKQLRKKQEKMLWKEMRQIGKLLITTSNYW